MAYIYHFTVTDRAGVEVSKRFQNCMKHVPLKTGVNHGMICSAGSTDSRCLWWYELDSGLSQGDADAGEASVKSCLADYGYQSHAVANAKTIADANTGLTYTVNGDILDPPAPRS